MRSRSDNYFKKMIATGTEMMIVFIICFLLHVLLFGLKISVLFLIEAVGKLFGVELSIELSVPNTKTRIVNVRGFQN